MGNFPVRYHSRVVIYEHKATVVDVIKLFFGGNLDFPKIKNLKKVCSDI